MSLPHREAPLDDYTVSGPSLLSLLHFAASQGAVVTGILEAHGLDARGLASPDVRVVQAVNDAVWSEVGRRVATPDSIAALATALATTPMRRGSKGLGIR